MLVKVYPSRRSFDHTLWGCSPGGGRARGSRRRIGSRFVEVSAEFRVIEITLRQPGGDFPKPGNRAGHGHRAPDAGGLPPQGREELRRLAGIVTVWQVAPFFRPEAGISANQISGGNPARQSRCSTRAFSLSSSRAKASRRRWASAAESVAATGALPITAGSCQNADSALASAPTRSRNSRNSPGSSRSAGDAKVMSRCTWAWRVSRSTTPAKRSQGSSVQ